jgi:uncharacterized pyridoxamine 5'-phosphate oxidase family protein
MHCQDLGKVGGKKYFAVARCGTILKKLKRNKKVFFCFLAEKTNPL